MIRRYLGEQVEQKVFNPQEVGLTSNHLQNCGSYRKYYCQRQWLKNTIQDDFRIIGVVLRENNKPAGTRRCISMS